MTTVPCPRCGYKKRKEIIYGLYHPQPGEENKYKVGGCLVTPHNTKWYCTKCRHEYGMKLFRNGGVSYFSLTIFNSLSSTIQFKIEFFESRTLTKIENIGTDEEITSNSIIQHKNYTKPEWRKLLIKLDNLYLFALKARYINKNIVDGTSWNLEIDSFISKKSNGQNAYPVYWDKIVRTLKKEFE